MYEYSKAKMDNRVFHFIYGCAMHDAILQKSFDGKKTWVIDVVEAERNVRSYIESVLRGDFRENNASTKEAHEKAFLKTANAVCSAINTSPEKASDRNLFSFGNAQKLINMTIKHVYAHTYSNPSIRECFRHCHCPLDSIMLSNVWKGYGKAFDIKTRRNDLGSSEAFHASWGNEGAEGNMQKPLAEFPPRYAQFQAAIQKLIQEDVGDCFPIEFDYFVWKSN